MFTRTCVGVVVLLASVSAQSVATSYKSIGFGCAGSSGFSPISTGLSFPLIGQTFFPAVYRGASKAAAFYVVGPTVRRQSFPNGCTLWTSPLLAMAMTLDGNGEGIGKVTIPSNAALLGNEFVAQWVVVDAGSSGGFVLSDARHGIVGNILGSCTGNDTMLTVKNATTPDLKSDWKPTPEAALRDLWQKIVKASQQPNNAPVAPCAGTCPSGKTCRLLTIAVGVSGVGASGGITVEHNGRQYRATLRMSGKGGFWFKALCVCL